MNVELTIILFWFVSLVMAYSSGRQDGRIKQKIEDTERLEALTKEVSQRQLFTTEEKP